MAELEHQRRRGPSREIALITARQRALLAARQRALITSRQLAALGVGRGAIQCAENAEGSMGAYWLPAPPAAASDDAF